MHSLFDLIPANSIELITDLINSENLSIKIVKTRKTKHGDFRHLIDGKFQITLNYIDNKFRFLITLVHELAHFKVSQSFKYRVNPHGFEWKKIYKHLMLPFLNNKIFPDDILRHLAFHMINPPATTDSDINLVIALHKYELNEDEKTFLFEVPLNSSFIFQENKKFIKLNKRRKRYICKNLLTGRKFLFSPVARVKINN
ncbi:SprT-like domain-containing protein [Flavobacteriaceae bacterium]|nr:SprT-like domain-containing protein [Flavobacteriaceae bacterium]MDB9902685.1 SprT-like domain-containing protein [Flavobacteriaceae bacterium]MDC0958631.1 SprT-like domain-containing protein [Flavobacteriaceae bacterium]